jgi:hypothetical protein
MAQFDYGNVNPFAAVQQGVDFSQGMIDKQAQRQAGNLLAQSASPAAQPLFQSGQLDQGAKVQQYGEAQQKQAIADHLTFLTKAASALSQIPDDGTQTARRQALSQHILPALQQMGATPQDLQQLQTTDLSDQSLSMFQQAAKLQIEKMGNDLIGVDPNGGKARVLYHGADTPKAAAPHWEKIRYGDKEYWVDLSKQAGDAPPTAPAGASPTPATPTAADPSAPRGIRNNNPLNLQPLAQGQWAGQTGTDGRYATFATPEAGMAAADKNLQSYATHHGIDTVQGIVSRWAPAGDGANDPAAYAATVAASLGVKPDEKLDLTEGNVRRQVLLAMAKVENGKALAAAPAQPPAGALATGGPPPGAIYAGDGDGKAKWEVLIDPKTQTAYRYDPVTAKATTLDGRPYAPEGASKMNGGGTPRSAAALAAQRYIQGNPNATADDISQFNAKMKMQANAATAFGTGKQGQTINSINVAVDHLGTMRQAADALRNGNIQLFNKLGNDFAAATGNDAPTNFDAVKQIVADEVVKSIVGSGAAAGDREKAQAILSRANSPEQLGGAISEIQKLMAGQLRGLRLQYKNSTGQDDFETHLLPETRQQLEKLEPSGGSSGASAAGAKRPPLSAIFGR